jgi:hypothetical protein
MDVDVIEAMAPDFMVKVLLWPTYPVRGCTAAHLGRGVWSMH